MRKLFLSLIALSVAFTPLVAQAQEVNPTTGLPYYTDDAQIGSWAVPSVDQLQLQGIMVGYPDGSFRPKADITREEFAVALEKAMMAIENRLYDAMATNNQMLYEELTAQQAEIMQLAGEVDMAEGLAGRNWVGLSIGATAVDDSDDVLVNLEGKIEVLSIGSDLYLTVNPFVSTAGEGGAALLVNKDFGKFGVGAGAGAAIGWDNNAAITSNSGDVEGYGQLQVDYDISDSSIVFVNGKVPFTGDNSGDVTIMGGVGLKF